MPRRSTLSGSVSAPRKKFARMAVLAAASQPSMSNAGLASANPSACAVFMALSMLFAASRREMTKLVVVLRMPGDASDPGAGQGPAQAEDRGAVHDRAFEKEAQALLTGQARKVPDKRKPPAPCWR